MLSSQIPCTLEILHVTSFWTFSCPRPWSLYLGTFVASSLTSFMDVPPPRVHFTNLLVSKCAGRHSSALFSFTNKTAPNFTIAPNFYAVRSTSCTSKIGVNLLAQKLHVKCWWNWPDCFKPLTIPVINLIRRLITFQKTHLVEITKQPATVTIRLIRWMFVGL